MSEYFPDRWVILKITDAENNVHYRFFAGWYGGYANGDSWRINSGIVKCELSENNFLKFFSESGSSYFGHENNYGMSGYMIYVFESIDNKLGGSVEVLNFDFESFLNLNG